MPGRRFANGMFSVYVDPQRINPGHLFDADVTAFLQYVREAKPMPGESVLTPGEPERAARAERLANGVPLADDTWASIVTAGRGVGVEKSP